MTRQPRNVSSLVSARIIRQLKSLGGLTQTTCDTESESCKAASGRDASALSPSGKARIWARIKEKMDDR